MRATVAPREKSFLNWAGGKRYFSTSYKDCVCIIVTLLRACNKGKKLEGKNWETMQ